MDQQPVVQATPTVAPEAAPVSQPVEQPVQQQQPQADFQRLAQEAMSREDFYRQLVVSQQAPKEGPSEFKDDDWLPLGDIKKVTQGMIEEKIGPLQEMIQQQRIRSSVARVESQHPDYCQVVSTYSKAVIDSGRLGPPHLVWNSIMQSDDPAQVFYDIAALHPSRGQQVVSQAAQQVADAVNANLNRPSTIGNMQPQAGQTKDWSNAPKTDVLNELRRLSQG